MLFSFINGLMLTKLLQIIPKEDLYSLIIQVCVVFGAMFSVGWIMHHYNLEWMHDAMMFPIIILSGAIFASVLYSVFAEKYSTSSTYMKVARLLSVLLAATYVSYNTYSNFNDSDGNDIIDSTLRYYTDVYALFTNIGELAYAVE
jgi:FtsH-binding integral membrane protein